MSNMQVFINRKIRQGWAMLGLGLALLAVGIGMRFFAAGGVIQPRWVEAVGIFLLAVGGASLVRYTTARRNPQTARQSLIDDIDERSVTLRHQAGYTAFLASSGLAFAGLMVYSLLTQGQGWDWLWLWMAALFILPVLVYTVYLAWLNSRS